VHDSSMRNRPRVSGGNAANAPQQRQAPTSVRCGVVASDPVAAVTSEPPSGTHRAVLSFTRCIHLEKAQIVRASESSGDCRALLAHVAKIAKPHDGAPLLLLLFARLATVACDWLDGDLVIEMEAIPPLTTRVTISTELGPELREKVFPSFDVGAPLDEFTRAVRRIPQMVEPLLVEITSERMILRASERVRSSAIPPEIGMDEALSSALGPPSRG